MTVELGWNPGSRGRAVGQEDTDARGAVAETDGRPDDARKCPQRIAVGLKRLLDGSGRHVFP
jgi:hypothetical protein